MARGVDPASDSGVRPSGSALVPKVHRPVQPGLFGRRLRADEEWCVRVEWFREGTSLRVEVHNPGFPVNVRLRRPDADDAHGRGLLLVDSIAESWHSGPSRFGGTVVSFLMADAWPA